MQHLTAVDPNQYWKLVTGDSAIRPPNIQPKTVLRDVEDCRLSWQLCHLRACWSCCRCGDYGPSFGNVRNGRFEPVLATSIVGEADTDERLHAIVVEAAVGDIAVSVFGDWLTGGSC